MVNGNKSISLVKTVGLFAFGAAIYLFVAPRLLTNPPFVQSGSFNFPGLTPNQVVDESQAMATFADDVVPGLYPQGFRLSAAY